MVLWHPLAVMLVQPGTEKHADTAKLWGRIFMPPSGPDLRSPDDLKVNRAGLAARPYRTTMLNEWLVDELPSQQAESQVGRKFFLACG